SRIYRILTNTGTAYALKSYPDLLIDPRHRLRNEVKACDFLEHLQLTPKHIAHDEELNFALFEWIDGTTPIDIGTTHIDQVLFFIEKLKGLSEGSNNNIPEASEACLSGTELLSQVQERIQKLDSINNLDLQVFLETSIKPLWEEIREWFESKWPSLSFETELSQSKQMLSPSDFGFHNSIQRCDGHLCFVDLEYFGRDDPVKLIADFLWHPAMDLESVHKRKWLESMFAIFDQDPDLQQRFRAAWPLYGMRWALIVLNEFRQDGWQKRLHAKEELQQDRKQIQKLQLRKAAQICDQIRMEKMVCPYV
nr:aminoglycoside phosphotransferase family protein [Dehalococcoidia bacterium]